jgi:hypothetical protein
VEKQEITGIASEFLCPHDGPTEKLRRGQLVVVLGVEINKTLLNTKQNGVIESNLIIRSVPLQLSTVKHLITRHNKELDSPGARSRAIPYYHASFHVKDLIVENTSGTKYHVFQFSNIYSSSKLI